MNENLVLVRAQHVGLDGRAVPQRLLQGHDPPVEDEVGQARRGAAEALGDRHAVDRVADEHGGGVRPGRRGPLERDRVVAGPRLGRARVEIIWGQSTEGSQKLGLWML